MIETPSQSGGRVMGLNTADLINMIDELQESEQQQSNCMLHLSLMVARLALDPLSEDYKDDASQTMIELVRAKRKDAPLAARTRFDPEQRKPWIVDVHHASGSPSALPVSAKFGSGGLD